MLYIVNKNTKVHRIMGATEPHPGPGYEYVPADADGWIEWNGGECPLPEGEKCEVRYRKYGTVIGEALNPKHNLEQSFWDDSGGDNGYDIVSYRPILEDLSCRTAKKDVGMHARDTLRDDFSVDEPTQWRGPEDGLPPVGSTTGVIIPGMARDVFEVLAHNKEKAVLYCRNTDMAISLPASHLKPIRTPEEIAEERAVEAMSEAYNSKKLPSVYQGMELVYAAIRDRRIPGVQLESQ